MKLADGNPLCLNPDTKSVKSWNISKQRLVTVQHTCSVPADWQNNAIGWGASISKTQTFLKPTSTPEISVLSHSVTQYVLRSLFWSVYQCSQVRPEAQHVGTGQGLQSWSTCCCKTTSCSPGCICFCYLKWCKQRKVLMVFLREKMPILSADLSLTEILNLKCQNLASMGKKLSAQTQYLKSRVYINA